MIENVYKWLADFGRGAVVAFGRPTEPVDLVEAPDGKGSVGLVRDGYHVERFPGRERHASQHRFEDVKSFAAWLNRHAKPAETHILVDPSKAVVGAALTPRDRFGDLVTCQLVTHPRLARWLAVFGRPIAQRDLHRLIIGALEDFQLARAADGTVLGSYGETLAGQLLKLEIVSDGKVTSEIDERGTIRFQGAHDKTTVTGSLPARFTLRVPWFIGVHLPATDEVEEDDASYNLEVLLRLDAKKDGPPTFTLECPALDVVRRAALEDAVGWLDHLLDEGFLVGIGALNLQPVPDIS